MQIQYDDQVKAVYLRLKEAEVASSKEVEPGIIFEFDDSARLIGIEILSVHRRSLAEMRKVSSVLTNEQEEEFKQFFAHTSIFGI